jgi:4-diphosphocytidyl-2-C-methyl-D-erythritol kinase
VSFAADGRGWVRYASPAKINLSLRVGPVQDDGFHPLVSWMATVGLFDTLAFRLSPPTSAGDSGSSGPVVCTCSDPSIPTDERNLVVRAALALRRQALLDAASPDKVRAGVEIRLDKVVPHGGGLGGGSSDAATTLVALNQLWHLGWPKERLATVAASVGSDVSFFLNAPGALCRGRGEIVQPAPAPAVGWAVLILPGLPMPTPAVYKQFDRMRLGADLSAVPDISRIPSWATLDAKHLLPELVNDLEAPAFAIEPKLGDLRSAVERTAGRVVRMSGSGSTLFTLADERAEAERLAETAASHLSVRAVAVELARHAASVIPPGS